MNDSSYGQPLPAARQLAAASGHRTIGSVVPGRFHTYPEMAAAGLWATPTNLAKFLVAIRQATQGTPTVLSPEMARQMITCVNSEYGLGLSLQGAGPTASFGHGGSNAGFKCQMTMHVTSGRGAVVMTNGDQGGRLAAEILRAVAREYDWPSFRPTEKTTVPVERALLALLTGRYELRPGKVLVGRSTETRCSSSTACSAPAPDDTGCRRRRGDGGQFRKKPAVGFSDCLMMEVSRKAGHAPLGTFDRDLGRLDGAERL